MNLKLAKIPLKPRHPERVCWGCDQHCRADAMGCGSRCRRTPHPVELLGENWAEASYAERHAPLTTGGIDWLRQVTEDTLCRIVTRGLGVAMADLGLEYRIRIAGTAMKVELFMATSRWSLGEQIAVDVEQALCAALDADDVEVQFVWTARRSKARLLPIAAVVVPV